MATNDVFIRLSDTYRISASSGTGGELIALPNVGNGEPYLILRVVSLGPSNVWFATGNDSLVVGVPSDGYPANGMALVAGQAAESFRINKTDTHFAVVCEGDGTATVEFSVGAGA